MKSHRSYWAIGGLCYVLSISAIVVALLNPASGYEYSIYSCTPLAFWICILCSIAGGVVLLCYEVMRENGRRWHFILGVLVLNGIAGLLLSIFRGYYAVGADTLMHLGYVKDLSNGIISVQNAYPAVHVFPTVLVLVGVSPILATNLSPLVWYGVYTASFYGLANEMWRNREMVIVSMVLAVALLLPMGVGFAATLAGASLFPLTLLALLRLRDDFNAKNLIFLALLLPLLAFLHPMALEVVLISLGLICLLSSKNRWKFVAITVALAPIVAWWCHWWFDMNVFGSFFSDLFASTITPSAPALDGGIQDGIIPAMDSSGLSLLPSVAGIEATQTASQYGVVFLILRRYGGEILLGLTACIALLISFRKNWRYFNFAYFGLMFAVFNVMWVAGWYLTLSKYDLALSRMLNWVPIVSIIVATPLLVWLLKSNALGKTTAICLLLIISCGALFNVYSSPFIGTPNAQITHQQIEGIEWLLDNGDSETPIVHLNKCERISRFVAAEYGVEWTRNNQKKYWLNEYRGVLDDFRYYVKGDSIGYEFSEDVYLVVTKLDRSLPRWSDDKLDMLPSDPATKLMYEDGDEFEVWLVQGLKGKDMGCKAE